MGDRDLAAAIQDRLVHAGIRPLVVTAEEPIPDDGDPRVRVYLLSTETGGKEDTARDIIRRMPDVASVEYAGGARSILRVTPKRRKTA